MSNQGWQTHRPEQMICWHRWRRATGLISFADRHQIRPILNSTKAPSQVIHLNASLYEQGGQFTRPRKPFRLNELKAGLQRQISPAAQSKASFMVQADLQIISSWLRCKSLPPAKACATLPFLLSKEQKWGGEVGKIHTM